MNTNRKVGTLMLVEVNKQLDQLSADEVCKMSGLMKHKFDDKWQHPFRFIDLEKRYNYILVQPIIICDDQIKVGDTIFIPRINSVGKRVKEHSSYHGHILRNEIDGYKHIVMGGEKKILVLPNQFSQEFLKAVVDGKMKDRNKVEVEIEINPDSYPGIPNVSLKLRKDGTAILHPYTESVEEAAFKYIDSELLNTEVDRIKYQAFKAGAEWRENQKK